MNTKDVLLVGAGVAVGYLLVVYMNKAKASSQATTGSTGAIVDQVKLADCTKKADEQLTLIKTTANFDSVAFKKNYIDNCMSASIAQQQ
jgi:hypothetical protein